MMQFFGLSSMKYELASDPNGHSAIKRRSSIGACHMVLPSSRANLQGGPKKMSHKDFLLKSVLCVRFHFPIWVSFCRTGKMPVSCHIFSKSRAFV